MKYKQLIVFFLIIPYGLLAQLNYVKDPSFEGQFNDGYQKRIPDNLNQLSWCIGNGIYKDNYNQLFNTEDSPINVDNTLDYYYEFGPNNLTRLDFKGWFKTTNTSPDYFNSNSITSVDPTHPKLVGVPSNFANSSQQVSPSVPGIEFPLYPIYFNDPNIIDESYAGLVFAINTLFTTPTIWNENISQKLKSPLLPNTNYKVTFKVSSGVLARKSQAINDPLYIADMRDHFISKMGVVISNTNVIFNETFETFQNQSQNRVFDFNSSNSIYIENNFLLNKNGHYNGNNGYYWDEVELTFNTGAMSDLDHITIGYFINDPNVFLNDIKQYDGSPRLSQDYYGLYYYIDHVELIANEENVECDCSNFLIAPTIAYQTCNPTENNKYCFDIFLPLREDLTFGNGCEAFGYTIYVNGKVFKEEFDNSQALDLNNSYLGEYCFEQADFNSNDEIDIEFVYYDQKGRELCVIPKKIEKDCQTNMNYEIINQTTTPYCCKTIKFNELCDYYNTISVVLDGNIIQTHILENDEQWNEKEITICDQSNEGKQFDVYLVNHLGQQVCHKLIEACESVDCCEGFEIKMLHNPNGPQCSDGCPVLIDVDYNNHSVCDEEDVLLSYNGNDYIFNGTPLTFCILSPGGVITGITTNLPAGVSSCSDHISINCDPNDEYLGQDDELFKKGNLKELERYVEFGYVYPNPSSNEITVNLRLKEKGKINYSIISYEGKRLFSEYVGEQLKGDWVKTINVGFLPSGKYFLKVDYNDLSVPFPIEIIK